MNDNIKTIGGCCGRWLLASLVIFVFIFAAEFFVHGIWLMPIYEETASLWRSQEEMQQLFPWMFLYQGLVAVLVSTLYCKCRCGLAHVPEGQCNPRPSIHALCFGLLTGVLFGVLHAAAYIWTPIPLELAIKWFVANVLEGVCIGAILSVVYRTPHN